MKSSPAKKMARMALLLVLLFQAAVVIYADEPGTQKEIEYGIYYKIDQGATWGVLSDRRMSSLHYSGPGGLINFGRYAHRSSYKSEWSFARLQYNYSKPAHKNTVVENPGAGLRYMYLKNIHTPNNYKIFAGGEINVFGNLRMAPRLGNSYLWVDMVGEIRPRADLFFNKVFLRRNWNIELTAATSVLGYTLRIPEYGVSFELSEDAGVKTQGFEQKFLLPHNYAHITTGLFIRESFRGESNPNWFRVGYVWDFYTMAGAHKLNTSNALHQLVIELYFRVR